MFTKDKTLSEPRTLDKTPKIMNSKESKDYNLTTFVHFCNAQKKRAQAQAIVFRHRQMGIHCPGTFGPPLRVNCFSTALPLTVTSAIPVISQPVWVLKLISNADSTTVIINQHTLMRIVLLGFLCQI